MWFTCCFSQQYKQEAKSAQDIVHDFTKLQTDHEKILKQVRFAGVFVQIRLFCIQLSLQILRVQYPQLYTLRISIICGFKAYNLPSLLHYRLFNRCSSNIYYVD